MSLLHPCYKLSVPDLHFRLIWVGIYELGYLLSNGVHVGRTKHYALKSYLHTRSKKIGKPKSKTRCALWGFRSRVSISFCISCGFHFPLRIKHCRFFQFLQINHAYIRKIYIITYTHLSRKNESESRGIYCLSLLTDFSSNTYSHFFFIQFSIYSLV